MPHQRDPLPFNRRNFSVDLSDPRARELLGPPRLDHGSDRREVVQLAGDAPDPSGITDQRGRMATTRLTGGKHEIVVVFGDLLMTVDVYALPGEPLKVHLICPRCHKMLHIRGDQKRIEYDPQALNPARRRVAAVTGMSVARVEARWSQDHVRISRGQEEARHIMSLAGTGRVSIETFECTWEMGDDRHVAGAVHTGSSLCRLRLTIDNNRAWEV